MKILIRGRAALSFDTEWFRAQGFEVWEINPHPARDPIPETVSFDVGFQLHGLGHLREKHGEAYLDYLSRIQRPLFMTRKHASIPTSVAFDLDGLTAFARSRYFDNSFPIAVVGAAMLGAKEIVLDGLYFREVEAWARECLAHWIGFVEGKGVLVRTNPGSGLMEHDGTIYGFEGPGSV